MIRKYARLQQEISEMMSRKKKSVIETLELTKKVGIIICFFSR